MALNFKKLLSGLGKLILGQVKDVAPAIIDKAKDDLTAKVTTEIANRAEDLKAKLDRKSDN